MWSRITLCLTVSSGLSACGDPLPSEEAEATEGLVQAQCSPLTADEHGPSWADATLLELTAPCGVTSLQYPFTAPLVVQATGDYYGNATVGVHLEAGKDAATFTLPYYGRLGGLAGAAIPVALTQPSSVTLGAVGESGPLTVFGGYSWDKKNASLVVRVHVSP